MHPPGRTLSSAAAPRSRDHGPRGGDLCLGVPRRTQAGWGVGRCTGASRIGRLMAAEAKESATESHQTTA